MRLCDSEVSLYQDFSSKSKPSQLHGGFQSFDFDQPMGSATNDLDTLFQIFSMLREERTSANDCGRRAISADVQNAGERLIFCANSTLLKYKPSASDVDYPNKLLKQTDGTRFICGCCVILVPRNMQLVYETWFPRCRPS
jgi:hypothetical protein